MPSSSSILGMRQVCERAIELQNQPSEQKAPIGSRRLLRFAPPFARSRIGRQGAASDCPIPTAPKSRDADLESLVPTIRLERMTYRLQGGCSTN